VSRSAARRDHALAKDDLVPTAPHHFSRPIQPLLGEGFADPVTPARFPKLGLRFRNQRWAERVGLGTLDSEAWEAAFARFEPLEGNLPQALALRYHGHQFQQYNPQLGDGRGFLYAQLLDPPTGRVLDLATKGSGKTPYSRTADGRLTLQGGVREILAAERLEALGVPTSKAFSLFETGESLVRHDEPSPARGSVLVRLSHSHIRFGTFQRHAHHGDVPRLQALVEHAVEHHLPEARSAAGDLPTAFLKAVCARTAELCAAWMAAGFVHGVLNTDNMVVTGESFDYGPWRFLPRLDPAFTAAYFDESGLYAYGAQPRAALWNLLRLAEAIRPLVAGGRAEPVMQAFEPAFRRALARRFRERLGLAARDEDAEVELLSACHGVLSGRPLSLDRFFHDWFGGEASAARALEGEAGAHYGGEVGTALRRALGAFEPAVPERLADPLLGEDPPSLMNEHVQGLFKAIAARDDWGPFEREVEKIRAHARLLHPPSTLDGGPVPWSYSDAPRSFER